MASDTATPITRGTMGTLFPIESDMASSLVAGIIAFLDRSLLRGNEQPLRMEADRQNGSVVL